MLCLMLASHGSAYPLSEANLKQARQNTVRTAVEQPSKTDDRHAPQIEYVEAKKIPINQAANMQGSWHAIVYEARSAQIQHPDENEWPAILCLTNENGKAKQECFKAVATGRGRLGICQYARELAVVPIFKNQYPQTGVLFVALGSSGGSGALHLITLWFFDENARKFENILPEITFSELGEYKILRGMGDALDGTLVVAYWVYEEREGHFSPHKYQITIYQYDQTDKKI